jgi:hypothetical protein
MAKEQFRFTESGGDEFFQPYRGRSQSAWQLGEECDARLLDAFFDFSSLL